MDSIVLKSNVSNIVSFPDGKTIRTKSTIKLMEKLDLSIAANMKGEDITAFACLVFNEDGLGGFMVEGEVTMEKVIIGLEQLKVQILGKIS